jgi:hypothetical protein
MKALFARIKSVQTPNPVKNLVYILSKLLKTILGTAIVIAIIIAIVATGWVLFIGVHRVGMYLGINVYHWWTAQSSLENLGPIPWFVGIGTVVIPAIILFIGYELGSSITIDIKNWINKNNG